jgi:hypothetical protein
MRLRDVNATDLPTAPTHHRGARPDCPGWCRDHRDDRANGGADLHQARLGAVGRFRVDVWQEVGGSINVELQIPGARAELLSAQDAAALAELLRTAAAAVRGPGSDEQMQPEVDTRDDDRERRDRGVNAPIPDASSDD